MKSLYIVSACCLLMACSPSTKPLTQPTPPAIPANALQRCDDLPLLQQDADMGHMAVWMQEVAVMYGECALRHDTLAGLVQ